MTKGKWITHEKLRKGVHSIFNSKVYESKEDALKDCNSLTEDVLQLNYSTKGDGECVAFYQANESDCNIVYGFLVPEEHPVYEDINIKNTFCGYVYINNEEWK